MWSCEAWIWTDKFVFTLFPFLMFANFGQKSGQFLLPIPFIQQMTPFERLGTGGTDNGIIYLFANNSAIKSGASCIGVMSICSTVTLIVYSLSIHWPFFRIWTSMFGKSNFWPLFVCFADGWKFANAGRISKCKKKIKEMSFGKSCKKSETGK